MDPLFAQFQQQKAGGPGADPAALAGIFACYAVVIVVAIVIQILFLLSHSRCLKQVARRNRTMEPGQVWLNLIPFFNLVWIFITVFRIAESLRNEYDDRNLRGDDDYGRSTGLIYTIGSLVCGPVGLVGLILYWVKIAGYTKELRADRGGYDDRDDDEDDRPAARGRSRRDDDDGDDDDRPRRKRRRDEDDEADDDEDDRPRRRR